jgi:hypothetical protein
MSVEQAQQPARPAIPNGQPETWVYLADWPLPPEGRERVNVTLREYKLSRQEIGWLEEGAKLGCFFGGQWVITMRLSGRLVVLVAGEGGFSERAQYLKSLPREMQSEVLIEYVNDPTLPLPEII